MVRRLAHGVMYIVVLKEVPAIHTVVHIDPRSGAVIYMTVSDANAERIGDEYTSALLGEHAHVMDEIVRRLAIHGDIIFRQ